jgi:aminopeptidase
MPDERIEQYARLLVDTCIDAQPEWQVLVLSNPPARPLIDAVCRRLGERGAYALVRLGFDGWGRTTLGWAQSAPESLLRKPSSIEVHAAETCDGLIAIVAPENTRELVGLPQDRLELLQAAYRPSQERFLRHEVPWVGCQYPTPALAQEAGMSSEEFADFLYGSVLLDWDAERERMQRYADVFDAGEEVRIVGAETDLTLSLSGRTAKVDAGGANIPGGEFFFCPVEDSAEGTIGFVEFPGEYAGRSVEGIRLRFEGGRVVDASADREEAFLLDLLDTDEGARRLGEFGIGCNPGITRYMRNVLFDEKIDGTVHLALGNGFPYLGGTNVSAIHWDIVKDLRSGGRLFVDGRLVQEDGVWRV